MAIRYISSFEGVGDHKVVINWMNGAWEVKNEEHAIPDRGVVDQFVRWFLGGTFWPRTDETDCAHIFRDAVQSMFIMLGHCHIVLSFDGARRGSGLGAGIVYCTCTSCEKEEWKIRNSSSTRGTSFPFLTTISRNGDLTGTIAVNYGKTRRQGILHRQPAQ